jgi:hypothetical protein
LNLTKAKAGLFKKKKKEEETAASTGDKHQDGLKHRLFFFPRSTRFSL